MTAIQKFGRGLQTFAGDVADGCFEMVGVVLAFVAITLVARPELRTESEVQLMGWLQERHKVTPPDIEVEADAVDRATAANPKDLPKQQAAVAYWLSKKYRVAPEPISALVAEAYEVGLKVKIDPTLILAVMAVESSFNPFAQSPVGAQGLMQVMTTVHTEKYDDFGGKWAAFDPVTNLRVGVRVLQECIARAGTVEGGLRQYVGATSDATEGGYAVKVMAEQERLRKVANGRAVPFAAPMPLPMPRPIPVITAPVVKPVDAEKVAALG
jgi:Transglycosylase SLT domain